MSLTTADDTTHYPPSPSKLAIGAALFAVFCVISAVTGMLLIRRNLAELGFTSVILDIGLALVVLVVLVLLVPAGRGLKLASRADRARLAKDAVTTRIDTAASRDLSFLTFGWGVFSLLLVGFSVFIFMNDTAVGKTFFLLPLIREKWWIVFVKFFSVNVVLCVVAEIFVLIWGLIVALARLMPGPAGQPIRALATLYCDVFRGLPGIVTLYLIGFGIPTSGLPALIYSLFVDTSGMTAGELQAASRLPVLWWCVLALTLTYGAYVAEVYRSGIESIHWSQVSAARSLGLSYLQTMRYVIVPQAVRRIMAPLLNDFIGLQKDTALVQVVGLIDAFNQSKTIASNAFNLSAVTVVAFLFVLITIPQARFVDKLLERDQRRMRAGG